MLALLGQLDPSLRAALVTTGRLTLVVGIAIAAHVLALRGFSALAARIAARSEISVGARLTTLSRVVRYLVEVVLFVITGSLVLSELGISIAPILATAGVAGVAIGFGAQALVRDYLNGFFLLFEDQLRQGEVVKIADRTGVVEGVTLRHVQLRDLEGKLIFVPNGEIKVVENLTRGFAQPLVDVGIARGVDVDKALAVLGAALQEAYADPSLASKLVEAPEVMGVEQLSSTSVLLRARVKVAPPLEQWAVRRELLRRIKIAFDREGIVPPD